MVFSCLFIYLVSFIHEVTNNVVLVSGVEQSDSVIYIYFFIFYFHILFCYRLLQDIEYSSLWYTVGPCCLSILYTVVCIC